jgi:hypothetical protein
MTRIKDRRTEERIPVMRSFLMITGLAALLASSSAAFAADGPGNSGRIGADRNRIILANDDRNESWSHRSDLPWLNGQNPYGGYNRGWQDDHRYGAPGWGWGYQQHRPLPKQVIRDRLRDQRFHDFEDWQFRDGYYRVRAEDRYGRDVRLVINAFNGRIVAVRRD